MGFLNDDAECQLASKKRRFKYVSEAFLIEREKEKGAEKGVEQISKLQKGFGIWWYVLTCSIIIKKKGFWFIPQLPTLDFTIP